MSKPPLRNIHELLGIICPVKIVDIGASAIDETPTYRPLTEAGQVQIVGFEPNQDALAILNQNKGPKDIYLPYVVGDGHKHTLYQCLAPGMTSLMKPNPAVLALFHNFSDWGSVVATHEVDTKRLDDIPETQGADFIKIDIQGAELMVLKHAIERLKQAVMAQVELEFLSMYEGQPLFAEVAQFFYEQGYVLHRFETMYSRTIKPVNPYAGLNQILWGDGIFIRDITRLEKMNPEQLLKLSVLLHECFRSYDVVLYLLGEHDRRKGTHYAVAYKEALENASPRIAYDQRLQAH